MRRIKVFIRYDKEEIMEVADDKGVDDINAMVEAKYLRSLAWMEELPRRGYSESGPKETEELDE